MCFLSRSRALNYRRRKGSPTRQQESGFHKSGTVSASAEPFALPATNVLHRDHNLPNHAFEDAKAFRDIFGFPPSVRSHEAAREIPRHGRTSKHLGSKIDLTGQTPTRSTNSRLGAF